MTTLLQFAKENLETFRQHDGPANIDYQELLYEAFNGNMYGTLSEFLEDMLEIHNIQKLGEYEYSKFNILNYMKSRIILSDYTSPMFDNVTPKDIEILENLKPKIGYDEAHLCIKGIFSRPANDIYLDDFHDVYLPVDKIKLDPKTKEILDDARKADIAYIIVGKNIIDHNHILHKSPLITDFLDKYNINYREQGGSRYGVDYEEINNTFNFIQTSQIKKWILTSEDNLIAFIKTTNEINWSRFKSTYIEKEKEIVNAVLDYFISLRPLEFRKQNFRILNYINDIYLGVYDSVFEMKDFYNHVTELSLYETMRLDSSLNNNMVSNVDLAKKLTEIAMKFMTLRKHTKNNIMVQVSKMLKTFQIMGLSLDEYKKDKRYEFYFNAGIYSHTEDSLKIIKKFEDLVNNKYDYGIKKGEFEDLMWMIQFMDTYLRKSKDSAAFVFKYDFKMKDYIDAINVSFSTTTFYHDYGIHKRYQSLVHPLVIKMEKIEKLIR